MMIDEQKKTRLLGQCKEGKFTLKQLSRFGISAWRVNLFFFQLSAPYGPLILHCIIISIAHVKSLNFI